MPKRAQIFRPGGAKGAADSKEYKTHTRRRYDKQRGSSTNRGYGSRWQKARAGYLAKHPLCCCCEATGLVEAATVVDHIVPHDGDKGLFWDRNNWQPLCKPCHDGDKQRIEAAWKAGRATDDDLRLGGCD